MGAFDQTLRQSSQYPENAQMRGQVQQPHQFYPQNQFQSYPVEIPPEVLAELEEDQVSIKNEKDKLPLNCVPGLKGKSNKQKFIIKVYTLLTIELLITFGFVLATFCIPAIQDFMKTTRWLFWVCIGVTLFLCFAMFCFSHIARMVPLNYVILLASICIYQTVDNVLIAAALTFTVFFALTIFTFFTKRELTVLSGLGVILCHVLLIMVPLFIVFKEKWIFILVCIAVIIIISIFIIYDTQMIAAGQKYGLGYDDYIVGALLLYTDVITLFLWILALMAASKRD
ncbi:hypothetical protein FGO68_gene6422 [Halteria grandinella]|uniref:Uncharacterized protein n=1 Tax=Halteria grandinella TaxID=5974 RepID=A0A8J8NQC2_HALGN|nr:hypothetical protein FGO68_gene6422 [Halteria grandinella]